MRQNATPFYVIGQSAQSASQADMGKLSGIKGYTTFHDEKQADNSIMQGKTPEQIMACLVVTMMEPEEKDVIIEMDDYDFVARYKDIEKFRRLVG